ncbi:mediator of RNA polymerase II transcription subunit 18 [Plasmodium brasilianum]|uniref:Mediator of RNA polymerase II transcription subunit 18 n=2 Tax=Plasmodium (Plasmodium) TaxID=418103 RepID=A0A1A8WF36_PLAMA|nr:conserved Plasmodium protein, unknown function [Plasmodium malariae]KAI4834859.1 mediator of RNA polymerase II transcription subunit 18 [Plasmodium brasilianum]SBS90667.1 conserved Plasmodium protein, unknown function [Plasmodium malariae]SCP03422.1 conserved Plasmodium protein, unknown function [Plasmodium malariae]
MSESVEQIFDDFISDFYNKNENSRDGDTSEKKNANLIKNSENKLIDDNILLNTLGEKNFFKYTEYSLSSLYISDENIPIDEDANFQKLINIITKASDVNNKFKWVDYYFKFDLKEESNILSPRSQNKDFLFREYLEPNHLKNISLLRKYEQGAILKSSEKNKVDIKIVSEYIVHSSYKKVITSFDYNLSHKIFAQAHIFHNKYGNSNHIVILVLRHYKDANFLIPLYQDRVLVQVKSYSNDNKYSEITQKNLLQYAEIFKPFISLRKVDYNFVEQIKEKITFAF